MRSTSPRKTATSTTASDPRTPNDAMAQEAMAGRADGRAASIRAPSTPSATPLPSLCTPERSWQAGGMFVARRPSDGSLDHLLAEQASEALTYREVGATRGSMPGGYRHDAHSVVLGEGDGVFDRAVQGLRQWEAHRGAGLTVRPEAPDVRPGTTIVVVLPLPLISAVAACRIVYVVDEPDTFGFAYGTLPAHPEQGEEAFIVSRDPAGTVRFSITAFSRPRHPLARLGGPVARRIQLGTTRRYLQALEAFTENA
jgi:uncharacterized protein (UPF0548 family)